jgi:Uma2 family endonuclease
MEENDLEPREEENEDQEGVRFPLWQIHDPHLDYLKRPDMTLEEFDREYPDIEDLGGDWFMEETPIMIRLLRGYRRLLVEKEQRERDMTTGTPRLTLEEFERRYAGQDTIYEYWLGEAVPRVGHTTLHGVTQIVVARLLDELGYWTSVGVDLHISLQWRPKPDVLASTWTPEEPYPTRPDDLLVVEILSPEDRWSRVHAKCEYYERITRIRPVYLLDPEARQGWEWSSARQNTERIASLALPKGDRLDVAEIWKCLEEPAQRQSPIPKQ